MFDIRDTEAFHVLIYIVQELVMELPIVNDHEMAVIFDQMYLPVL